MIMSGSSVVQWVELATHPRTSLSNPCKAIIRLDVDMQPLPHQGGPDMGKGTDHAAAGNLADLLFRNILWLSGCIGGMKQKKSPNCFWYRL